MTFRYCEKLFSSDKPIQLIETTQHLNGVGMSQGSDVQSLGKLDESFTLDMVH